MLNLLARSLIWVLWLLRRRNSKETDSPKGKIINEDCNTIEYFESSKEITKDGSNDTTTNILVVTGAGRVNTAENLESWRRYLGPDCNICIPNLPGYGNTSRTSGKYKTSEDQILHNQQVLLECLGWKAADTVLLGISYGSFVAVSTLRIFSPKLIILISPGTKIRETHFDAEFGLFEIIRYHSLRFLAMIGVPEARSFNSEMTLGALSNNPDRRMIYAFHGSDDTCIKPQASEDLSKAYGSEQFHLITVQGANHGNTRWGEAEKVIQEIIHNDTYQPPTQIRASEYTRTQSAD